MRKPSKQTCAPRAVDMPVSFIPLLRRQAADRRAALAVTPPLRSKGALLILGRLADNQERIIYQKPGSACPNPHPWWLQRPQIGKPSIHLGSFRALVRGKLIAESHTNAFTPDGHCDAAYYAALGHTIYEITLEGRTWLAGERQNEVAA